MGLVEKAVWYVESHSEGELSLEDIARACCVSRFHLARTFSFATGVSLMGYVRHRRLSMAARALADGEPDILALAQRSGYGSHEAFTRAFREHFGTTPRQLRERGETATLPLTEALEMNHKSQVDLSAPTFEDTEALLLAGVSRSHGGSSNADIPRQWQQFHQIVPSIPDQVGARAFGAIHGGDDDGNFQYLCGVEVTSFAGLPEERDRLRLAPQRYAVFTHPGHVSEIRATCHAIFSDVLPASDLEPVDAPFLEVYPETFDPQTGRGGLEIWVPVAAERSI